MKISIIYEDEDILVIDKPAGMTVNRAETTRNEETVQDWSEPKLNLERKIKNIEQKGEEGVWDPVAEFYNRGGPPATHFVETANNQQRSSTQRFSDPAHDFALRAGIVHRLDKETSGVLILAKNPEAFVELQRQFKERIVKKSYTALAHGKIVPQEGEVSIPVGRLSWNRMRFGVVPGGRESVTFYKVIAYYQDNNKKAQYSYVALSPKTGRTHQIRVHLKYLGYPIFADFLYAGRKTAKKDRKIFARVFLHAAKISFIHPKSGKEVEFESPLPGELESVLKQLERVD